MSHKKILIPLLILLLILTLTGCFGKFLNTPSLNDQNNTLSLDPNELILTPGEDFTVSLITPAVQNLKAYSVTLSYDPKLIRFNEATEGSFFSSRGETFFYREIDHQQGSILMDCAILGRELSVSGQGILATLSFTCLKAGSAEIIFKEVDTRDTYNEDLLTTQKGALVKSQ